MNQTVYILILVSLLILFLINKYEREKLQKILQEQLLKDETFKASIKEQIQTTENINDVIHAINKDYRLGLLLAKEITDQLK
ncbi:MarR family transcriptional regulator [Streptococcus australis]|uniref:MarR family transcriptional regulator n=1 Tax=Streptococcus australis TaxID=113107 RepID=UPI0032EF4809